MRHYRATDVRNQRRAAAEGANASIRRVPFWTKLLAYVAGVPLVVMTLFWNVSIAKPTTGRPTYVAGPTVEFAKMSVTIVASFPSVCTSPVTVLGKKPMSSQPFSKSVEMFAELAEPSRFELLNVMTFASSR